jgi:hypothetical protein
VGGVVVGEATFLATSRLFDYQQLGPVQVKGKAEPAAAAWEAHGHLAEHGLALLGAGRCLRRLGRPEAAARLRRPERCSNASAPAPCARRAGAWLPGAAAG